MKIVYSSKYEVDLGEHPFNTTKYRLIKELLQQEFKNIEFVEPPDIDIKWLLKVHTKEYVEKVLNLKLSYFEILRLEIPLTKQVSESAVIAVSGTVLAAKLALEQKIGVHIGGGWHHAYPDHGEGFCVFNDLAVGVRYLQETTQLKKFAVIDCDVHQGNGTAKIFEKDTDVFTFSIHQREIYPFPKEKSSLDIELPAYSKDKEYLQLLEEGLKEVKKFSPQMVFYQAGADVYENDRLAQLKITKQGIIERDRLVKKYFNDVPVVVTLGGGYAEDVRDTAEIHFNTIKVFLEK